MSDDAWKRLAARGHGQISHGERVRRLKAKDWPAFQPWESSMRYAVDAGLFRVSSAAEYEAVLSSIVFGPTDWEYRALIGRLFARHRR